MKYMVERNHINVLRREVLRRVAESFLHYADFGNSVERIPFVMRPKNTRPNRCCIYKDRAILRFQVMAALLDSGLKTRKTTPRLCPCMLKGVVGTGTAFGPNPVAVCGYGLAGVSIPARRLIVTGACQNCIAHPCIGPCHF